MNEKIYIHRERGYVVIPKGEAKKIAREAREGRGTISEFTFSWKKFKENEFLNTSNFEADPVYIYWKGKPLGRMNWMTGKISFDTKVGLIKRARELELRLLERGTIQKPLEIEHKYVEICARFPRELYQESLKKMDLVRVAFRTKWTHCHEKRHDAIELPYLCIIKNLLFNQYRLNLKVYLAVKYRGNVYSKDYIVGEDLARKPKIEVQISKIKDLEIAKSEAIPIILAFLDSIGATTLEMDGSDYELVGWEQKNLQPYQQILGHLNYTQPQFNLFISDKRAEEIICSRRAEIIQQIIRKPLSKGEILEIFDTSKNTVEADLRVLLRHRLICARGRDGIAKMFAFNWARLGNNRPTKSLPEESVIITRH